MSPLDRLGSYDIYRAGIESCLHTLHYTIYTKYNPLYLILSYHGNYSYRSKKSYLWVCPKVCNQWLWCKEFSQTSMRVWRVKRRWSPRASEATNTTSKRYSYTMYTRYYICLYYGQYVVSKINAIIRTRTNRHTWISLRKTYVIICQTFTLYYLLCSLDLVLSLHLYSIYLIR